MNEVIGYSTAELIETMLSAGIHTSVDSFKRLAIELQRRALAHRDAESALDRMVANAQELGLYDEAKCGCQTCQPITLRNMRMIVCETCGNKRCPHANDHRNECSGSNEPGQPGSSYPAIARDAQSGETEEEMNDDDA